MLLRAQRRDRIDARRAPRRQPSSTKRDEHEQRDDADERQRIARFDAVQQARRESRGAKGAEHAETPAQQVEITRRKAGIPPDAPIRLERFTVTKEASP